MIMVWIRSQDRKTLLNASDFHVVSSYKVFGIYSGIYALGYYSTKEKALKVMDMIQKRICFCTESYTEVKPVLRSDMFDPYWKKCESVLNMPQDDEV